MDKPKRTIKSVLVEWAVLVLVTVVLLGALGIPAIAILSGTKVETPVVQPTMTFPDLVERLSPGVVHILQPGKWQGSGFFIANDIICTARHVAEGGTDFVITLVDGTKLHASKALSSVHYDVAFIMLDKPYEKAVILHMGSIVDCRLGEDMFAIGNPYGLINQNCVTKGILSGKNRNLDPLNSVYSGDYGWSVAFSTTAPGHPGNSGCPVFSIDGMVRGVLVGGHSPVLIYCMPSDLFLFDGDIVRMMFRMLNYHVEKNTGNPEIDNSYTSKGGY